MNVERFQVELGRPREVEQLFDQLVYPVNFADHDVGIVAYRRIAFGITAQQLRRAFDSAQGVFDLMGEARGEGSQSRQAIGPFQVLFQFALVAQIAQQQDGSRECSLAILQRRGGDADRDLAAPAGDEVALAAGALAARRQGLVDQLDQPGFAFENLLQGLSGGGGR